MLQSRFQDVLIRFKLDDVVSTSFRWILLFEVVLNCFLVVPLVSSLFCFVLLLFWVVLGRLGCFMLPLASKGKLGCFTLFQIVCVVFCWFS